MDHLQMTLDDMKVVLADRVLESELLRRQNQALQAEVNRLKDSIVRAEREAVTVATAPVEMLEAGNGRLAQSET